MLKKKFILEIYLIGIDGIIRMKKLVIVGIFFDGYKDLWYDFIYLFEENWLECLYDMYIIN